MRRVTKEGGSVAIPMAPVSFHIWKEQRTAASVEAEPPIRLAVCQLGDPVAGRCVNAPC
jgi:hypothetical protein